LRSCKNDPVLDQVKYVVLTAHHDVEVTERMQRLGADRILHKPLHKTELLLAVVELLGGTHADG
jgi:DNA-binding NarL/FixJ family response regulator